MKTITHEGVEYLEKTHVDELVRSRIAKVSERARFAEGRVKELEGELDTTRGAASQVEALTSTVEGLQAELKQASEKYSIHSTIASHGFVDNDTRDMIEWSYRRAMDGVAQKERVELGEWIDNIKASPEAAPSHLRPLLASTPSQAIEEPQGASQAPTNANISQPPTPTAPPSNQGVQATKATGEDLVAAALSNPEMWREQNEAIKEIIYGQNGLSAPFKW